RGRSRLACGRVRSVSVVIGRVAEAVDLGWRAVGRRGIALRGMALRGGRRVWQGRLWRGAAGPVTGVPGLGEPPARRAAPARGARARVLVAATCHVSILPHPCDLPEVFAG